MKHLLTIDETDFGRLSQVKTGQYWQRLAVRAVVLDEQGKIYLMHMSKRGTYKLPGGGVDDGEDPHSALSRELMEEVGVDIEVIDEIGQVIEYRDGPMMEQISLCYLAKQVGEKGEAALEPGEIAVGMREIQADGIDHAIELVASSLPSDGDGQFMYKRELAILHNAKKIIESLTRH